MNFKENLRFLIRLFDHQIEDEKVVRIPTHVSLYVRICSGTGLHNRTILKTYNKIYYNTDDNQLNVREFNRKET
jgi:hypothetical protein